MNNLRSAFFFLGVGALLLTGCANVPDEHFYTLIGTAGASGDGSAATPGLPAITIASITLPEAVDRAELVIRSGTNRLTLLENERWAESLKTAIPRAIADDISQALGGAPVSVQSDNASREARFLVMIDVTRFDSTLGEAAAIEAFWSVRPVAGGAVKSGRSSFRVPVQGPGYDELVAAHALALSQLAGEIAAQIKTIEMPAK